MSRVIALSLAATLAAGGCSAYKGTVWPAPRAGAMPVWRADAALAVGVDTFADRERQKAVFDADFFDKRILALQLMVQNQRPEPVLVRRAGVTLTLPDGQEIARVTAATAAAQMDSSGDTLAWGIAFGLIGGLAAAQAEEGERTARRADYEAKEFREDVILQTGEAAHGFLYFVPPRGTPPFTYATLTLRFADPKESVITPLRVPLAGLRFRGAKDWEDDLKAGRGPAPTPPTDAPSQSTPVAAPSQPASAPLAPTAPATAAATPSAPARPAGPEAELKALIGTWTGTLAGPPRSGNDSGIRQDVTLRIFEEGGEIRFESTRRLPRGLESRGSGTVALSEDGIVMSGRRWDPESSSATAVPLTITFIRRGRTLEGLTLGADNVVYRLVLTRS
jgi:hypothetical protein